MISRKGQRHPSRGWVRWGQIPHPRRIGGQHLYLEPEPGWHLLEFPFRIVRDDGKVLGIIAYRHLSRLQASAELGIELYPEYRGRGYGTEAVRTFLRYLFASMGLRRVWLRVFADNEPALRTYRKCGFRPVGEGKAYLFFPCLVMAITREEFATHDGTDDGGGTDIGDG
ncbi:MAG TPA: GNAT family N-acetyltransferase [Firmicutes bacterium]|nr:GNAT family N-acetyltransferase [Bacillota bacterium]